MGQKHEALLQAHHVLHQKEIPQSRIFRRDTGFYYRADGTPIIIGKKGMGDAWSIIKVKEFLIHVEYEYKIGQDKQSKEQKDWQKMIESLGGLYVIVKDEPYTSIEIVQARIKELEECSNTF